MLSCLFTLTLGTGERSKRDRVILSDCFIQLWLEFYPASSVRCHWIFQGHMTSNNKTVPPSEKGNILTWDLGIFLNTAWTYYFGEESEDFQSIIESFTSAFSGLSRYR